MRMRRVLAAGLLLATAMTWSAGPAGAAGITTHRWMAQEAIDQVADASLRTLLTSNMAMLQTGAGFPDVGYVAPNTYGETAHWQRFVDNLIEAIRARTDCGVLTDPTGPCAPLIAFTFGVAAHGMGDEVWDWLFEPNGPDRNEYWTGVPMATDSGAEAQMDLVAIGRYGVAQPAAGTVPDEALVLNAFVASGQSGVDASQFGLVGGLPVLWSVEKGWADEFLDDVEAAMPWMSANLVTAPGGVDFAAKAIAGYWDSEWGHLLGNQPATRVSVTYPAPGQTGVPATGWDRASFQPGSDHGRGGAQNRITAVLTSARPYTGAIGQVPVSDELPAGSMTITDVATGDPVPLKASYPRSVPYGSDAGEHTIDTQPAGNLATCTWYQVDVSTDTPVLDHRASIVTPYSWRFRTECDDDVSSTTTTTSTTIASATTSTTVAPATTATTVAPATTGAPARTSTVPRTDPPATSVPAPSTSSTRPDHNHRSRNQQTHHRSRKHRTARAAHPVRRSPRYTG